MSHHTFATVKVEARADQAPVLETEDTATYPWEANGVVLAMPPPATEIATETEETVIATEAVAMEVAAAAVAVASVASGVNPKK